MNLSAWIVRVGLDFLSDVRLKIIAFHGLMEHHIFIKWRCKCCLSNTTFDDRYESNIFTVQRTKDLEGVPGMLRAI